jgi:hypothetical protein
MRFSSRLHLKYISVAPEQSIHLRAERITVFSREWWKSWDVSGGLAQQRGQGHDPFSREKGHVPILPCRLKWGDITSFLMQFIHYVQVYGKGELNEQDMTSAYRMT